MRSLLCYHFRRFWVTPSPSRHFCLLMERPIGGWPPNGRGWPSTSSETGLNNDTIFEKFGENLILTKTTIKWFLRCFVGYVIEIIYENWSFFPNQILNVGSTKNLSFMVKVDELRWFIAKNGLRCLKHHWNFEKMPFWTIWGLCNTAILRLWGLFYATIFEDFGSPLPLVGISAY